MRFRPKFKAYKMLDDRVKFLKGWFKDTLPSAPIKSLAVMRLDGDYVQIHDGRADRTLPQTVAGRIRHHRRLRRRLLDLLPEGRR